MIIQKFDIPKSLESDRFIQSLYEQSKIKTLSDKQINALKSVLNIEIPLLKYKTKTVKMYKQYFFRADYHGDILQDSRTVYDIVNPSNKIQDLHALQYSTEKYINEYQYVFDVEIPFNVVNVDYFMNFYYEDYTKLIDKIERNKFRSTKTRNNAAILLNKMIQGDVNTMENIPSYNYNHR
jgi:metal-sulfur cluster biosynthetic enzyme